jgi:hypothetical protein
MTYTKPKRQARARSHRRRDFLPSKRWQRIVIYIAVALGYAALMWYYVFPWADRIVNRPTITG